jgi:acylphosphatase
MPTYRIHFTGLVQGVGFRATCRRLARELPGLAGQVCNLPDGRVRLIVRGPAENVNQLIDMLNEQFPGYISGVSRDELPPSDDPLPPELSGVQIRH